MKKRIVIIGTGIGGTLLANKLCGRADVTTLEIGPGKGLIYPSVVFPSKELAHIRTFCHAAGGGSNLWHNGLIPIRSDDVRDEHFRSLLEDCWQYGDETAQALHFPSSSYSSEYANLLPQLEDIAAGLPDFPAGLDALLYPNKYAPLQLLPQVEALYGARIQRIDFDAGSVSRLHVAHEHGQLELPVDQLIVCAGGIGSPGVVARLLENSGHTDHRAGVGFIDHPMGFVGKFRFPRSIARVIKKLSLLDRTGYQARSIMRLRSPCGNYTGGVFFRPALTMSNELALYKYKSLLGVSRGMERVRHALSPRFLHPDIQAEVVAHLFPVQIPTRTYSVLFIGEQRRAGNRVYEDNSGLHVDWDISASEIQVYTAMIAQLGELLKDVSDEVVLQENLTPDWFWSAAHHSGSISLGPSESDLLDGNLRLRKLANVHVCDASVIQEHSYANTGFTIGQLAMRLATHLLND